MELQATRQAVAAAAAALACWNVPLSQPKQPRSVIAPELEMAPRRDRLCASLQKVSCHRSARAWWHRTLTTRHVLGPPHVRRRRVSGAEIAMWGCSAMGHGSPRGCSQAPLLHSSVHHLPCPRICIADTAVNHADRSVQKAHGAVGEADGGIHGGAGKHTSVE